MSGRELTNEQEQEGRNEFRRRHALVEDIMKIYDKIYVKLSPEEKKLFPESDHEYTIRLLPWYNNGWKFQMPLMFGSEAELTATKKQLEEDFRKANIRELAYYVSLVMSIIIGVMVLLFGVAFQINYHNGNFEKRTGSSSVDIPFEFTESREFNTKMMTRQEQISFYVKENYSPRNNEETEHLFNEVEYVFMARKHPFWFCFVYTKNMYYDILFGFL